MQFPTLAIFLVSAGLTAAQNQIGNVHPDGKCMTKISNPVYLNKCQNLENVNSIAINAPGFHCYVSKTAGCLDAGKPVKVAEGCHHISKFPDAKFIRCRSL
ncbi:hypothetical protein PG994_001473 [Apiospora phragmitis]|uniref:Uncharacterized protein n=1 Tax=Apiospora phragmitis TaxID=2905665 RepID=A0ABR1WTK7_9PEZI